jgi:integrase
MPTSLEPDGDQRNRRSTRTQDYAYRILKSCLEFATRLRLIPFNPMAGLPAPKGERSEKTSFTRAEARAYLEASQTQRLEPLFLLVLTTGLRRSELLGLRWQDLDFVQLELRVRQRLRWIRGGGFDIAPPKTTRSRRTILIASDVAEALKRWRTQQQLERSYAGSAWEEFGLVFTTNIGCPVHSITISDAHRAVLKEAGLRHLTFHELRHSFTSLARADGVDLKVISEILGHASVAFTADFYQHTFDDMRRAVARSGQELIGSSVAAPVILEPDRLVQWFQLVAWLANRPHQGAQASSIPQRLRELVGPANAAERESVHLVCHMKRLGWCLQENYETRLKQLEQN